MISSGTKVRTIVTLVSAEQGRQRVKLRHLNFDPYRSRTHARPWVTLVATHEACLNSKTMEMIWHLKFLHMYIYVQNIELLVVYR